MAEDREPTPPPGPQADHGWGLAVLLALVTAIALVGIGAVAASVVGGGGDPETVTFVVPEGAAEAAYFGEPVDVMPSEVRLEVGDTLVIRNEDTQAAAVGPYTVRAGETLRQTFSRPQTLTGECTLSGTGEVKLIVT